MRWCIEFQNWEKNYQNYQIWQNFEFCINTGNPLTTNIQDDELYQRTYFQTNFDFSSGNSIYKTRRRRKTSNHLLASRTLSHDSHDSIISIYSIPREILQSEKNLFFSHSAKNRLKSKRFSMSYGLDNMGFIYFSNYAQKKIIFKKI